MFDASLADISDRQSSISSLFTYVFNIDSLLKATTQAARNEQQDTVYINYSSLSSCIEEFLKHMLFKDDEIIDHSLYDQLSAYRQQLDGGIEESAPGPDAAGKLYFTIQNFITYLTYRSNGSPKKMIRAIQEFIVVKEHFDYDKNLVVTAPENPKKKGQAYLYFNYRDQYKIGFLSYLYRPFIVQFGGSFKLFSDNINVSMPYLFDHLIKFHPFAFSITNLELIPEVLSSNKTPSLKGHIQQIINHLAANHIRETEIGLFDYKFYSRTRNEIVFLSKIYDQEAAAFNFTLDESYLVKVLMINKIRGLRNTYAKFASGEGNGGSKQIYSIALINGILGDLHFFDQEYDDAIVAYSDAIKQIDQMQPEHMNMRDFVSRIKNQLKLGLCFEKTGSYDEALAFYTDSCKDARKYMDGKFRNGGYFQLPARNEKKKDAFHDSSLNDVLEIILQCFLAKNIVQEKMGIDGISGAKISIDFGSFLRIVEGVEGFSNRSRLIAANGYLLTGKLLYYKNSFTGFNDTEHRWKTLPETAFESMTKLLEKYGPVLLPEANKRKPVLALYLYILGLCELMASRDVMKNLLAGICEYNNIVYALQDALKDHLEKNDQRISGLHSSEKGTFLSNIGDCILSMYISGKETIFNDDTRIDGFKNFQIADIVKLKGYQKGNRAGHRFEKFLQDASKEKPGMADVFRCYFLSGRYYMEYGRAHTCGFQYRKILWILKLILNNNKDEAENSLFIDFLENTLIIPLLEITSGNSSHSEAHGLKKAMKFGIGGAFAMNNLSNHPETREIILLFNYIKIKLGGLANVKHIISPYNSFASQYSRMLELDFYAKHLYNQLRAPIKANKRKFCKEKEAQLAYQYLFSMSSILRILKIYGTDFIAGHSFYAYTHFRVADFLAKIKGRTYKIGEQRIALVPWIESEINYIFQEKSFSPTDSIYHYQMAIDLYKRAIQLHTAGKEYHKVLGDMIYLEDDFNDNAYHFGAAFERYMMINNAFGNRIGQCERAIKKEAEYSRFAPEAYVA